MHTQRAAAKKAGPARLKISERKFEQQQHVEHEQQEIDRMVSGPLGPLPKTA